MSQSQTLGKILHPNAIKQGYLTKSPPLHKKKPAGWKRRWFIFETHCDDRFSLSYYMNEDQSIKGMPKDRLFLDKCFRIEVDLDHSSRKNVFSVHLPERVYYLSSDSRYEMNEWVDTLCSHLSFFQEEVAPGIGVKRKTSLWLPASHSKLKFNSLPADSWTSSFNEYGSFPGSCPQSVPSFSPPTPSFANSSPSPSPRSRADPPFVEYRVQSLPAVHRPLPPTPPTSPYGRSLSEEPGNSSRKSSDPSFDHSLLPPIPPRKHSTSSIPGT